MVYTELTKKALKLCYEVHKEQTDKSGMPYVFHPFHLAEQMPDEVTTVVALLHDVIEDTLYTVDDLRNIGFPPSATDAIALMTHDKRVPYLDYVARIMENQIARTVKLADLRHNSDLTRLDHPGEKDRERAAKYVYAIRLLEGGKIEAYRWLNEAVGDFDLFLVMDRDAYDTALKYFGNDAKTSYMDGHYYFFVHSRRKTITPMPFLSLAFGGMYDELPIGDEIIDFNLCWEDYRLEPSAYGKTR